MRVTPKALTGMVNVPVEVCAPDTPGLSKYTHSPGSVNRPFLFKSMKILITLVKGVAEVKLDALKLTGCPETKLKGPKELKSEYPPAIPVAVPMVPTKLCNAVVLFNTVTPF